jgi:exodeoxyribonuclease-3
MRFVTVNVNGVRAALKKGFEGWLATAEADVICPQEMRAPCRRKAPRTIRGWPRARWTT